MPVQDRLNNFVSAITNEARASQEQIQQETQNFVSSELEKAKNEALYESYHLIQQSISRIRSEVGKEVSEKVLEFKNSLIQRRNGIWHEVFKLVEQRVKTFVNSNDYEQFLKSSIHNCYKLLTGSVTVYVRPADVKYEDLIKSIIPDCDIAVDETIQLGGIKIEEKGGRRLIDDTLDCRIRTEFKQFTKTSELIIS